MTEMNKDLERELREVRTNFNAMAVMLRNGRIDRTAYVVPPMGMTFRSLVDMRYWYQFKSYTARTRLTGRSWHSLLQSKYRLHKAVEKCMDLARPVDWHQLLLEWPHVSDTDPSRLAYTRDERAGEADRQVVTTIGKYITRHFPTLAAHQVRDITALFAADQCKEVHTTAEMIYHLHRGPKSCMQWGEANADELEKHPYNCYSPRLGWSMAIRQEGGDTVARALVYRDSVRAYFVRSYTKNDSFSHSDTILEAWLISQGIKKRSSAEGAKLAKVSRGTDAWGNHRYVFPYIDGEVKTVDLADDHMLVTENGEYLCNNTDGTADDNGRSLCGDCGSREDTDDGYWVGMHEDSWVCDSCHDDYYYAYGRNGRQYYLHQDNVVLVHYTAYDPDYLSDNSIVELHDGDYADLGDAVYIESKDAYYLCDDEEVCHDRDGVYQMRDDCVELENGEWCLEDEAWQCEHSHEWYANDDVDSVVTVCGLTIHPDYAHAYKMPEGYEATEVVAEPAPEIVDEPVKEVAAEPAPFPLSGGQSSTSASPLLRDEVIYDVDGLRVTKNYYINIDLIRYQATKRVYERELCVAHNALRCDFINTDGVEARIVAHLCEQIANMEAELHRQFFTTHILNTHPRYYWGPQTASLIRGHEVTHIVHDEVGVAAVEEPRTVAVTTHDDALLYEQMRRSRY